MNDRGPGAGAAGDRRPRSASDIKTSRSSCFSRPIRANSSWASAAALARSVGAGKHRGQHHHAPPFQRILEHLRGALEPGHDRGREIGLPLDRPDVVDRGSALAPVMPIWVDPRPSVWRDDRCGVRMDIRWHGDDNNRIRALARELVGLQPDVILTNGPRSRRLGR